MLSCGNYFAIPAFAIIYFQIGWTFCASVCGIPSIYFPSECLSHTVGPRSRGNVSGSAATDTVWIRTNRPCLSYFRPHRGVAELLFAGAAVPTCLKTGVSATKIWLFWLL